MSTEAADQTVRVTSEETSPVIRTLSVEVDPARVRKAFDRAYKDLGKRVKVRGFRAGKIPRSVLEKLYGAAVIEDIERMLVAETLPEAVAEAGVTPVAEPQIDATPPLADAPFRYTATIEVTPEFELPSLKGLEGKRPPADVDDAAVDAELENLRERRAMLTDEGPETAAAIGHTLAIDYTGRIDGETFEGGSAKGALVELGSGRFIPGFEDQLVGAKAGDDREIEVDFPDDYGDADVAGKHATFAVHVESVRRRELPPLDDTFAKDIGGFDDLAALRERVAADIAKARERESRTTLRRSLLDWILERVDFEVPPGMVDRRLEGRLSAAHQQLQNALPHDDLHAQLSTWRDQWRPDAEREVREDLVLAAVAREEKLQATDEEVDAQIEGRAREQGMAPARLRQLYVERGLLPAVQSELIADKALDHLASQAKIDESSGT